jgi:hypothetical protein
MLSQITSFKLSNDDEFVAAAGIYFANTGARPTGERRADMNHAQWRGISIVNAIAGPTQTCIPIAIGIGIGLGEFAWLFRFYPNLEPVFQHFRQVRRCNLHT